MAVTAPQEALLTTPRCLLHPHSAEQEACVPSLRGPALHVTPDKAGRLAPGSSQASADPLLTLNLRFHLPLTLFWLFSTHAFRNPSWSPHCSLCPSRSQPSNTKTDPRGDTRKSLRCKPPVAGGPARWTDRSLGTGLAGFLPVWLSPCPRASGISCDFL